MHIRLFLLLIFVGIGIYMYVDSNKKGLPGRFSLLLLIFSLFFPVNLIFIPLYFLFGRRILAGFSKMSKPSAHQSRVVICSKCGTDQLESQDKCSGCGNELRV